MVCVNLNIHAPERGVTVLIYQSAGGGGLEGTTDERWYRQAKWPLSLQQIHNTEDSKQIFAGKELRGYSPNSYIHVSVSDLYIPLIGLPNRKIGGPNVCIYKDRSQTHECGNWNWGRAIPWKGIHKCDFRCSVSLEMGLLLSSNFGREVSPKKVTSSRRIRNNQINNADGIPTVANVSAVVGVCDVPLLALLLLLTLLMRMFLLLLLGLFLMLGIFCYWCPFCCWHPCWYYCSCYC